MAAFRPVFFLESLVSIFIAKLGNHIARLWLRCDFHSSKYSQIELQSNLPYPGSINLDSAHNYEMPVSGKHSTLHLAYMGT